jgi:hypothetical protein
MYRGEYGNYPKLKKKELLVAVSGGNSRSIVFWKPKEKEKRFLRATIQGDIDDFGELIDGWMVEPFLVGSIR